MQVLASALQRCIKSRGSSRERPHTVDVPKSSGLDTSEHTPKQVWSNLASVRMSLFSPMDPLQNRSHMGLVPLQRTSTPEQSLSHRAELFPTPEFSRHPVRRRSTRHGDTYDLVGEGIQASRSAWPRCGTQLHAGDLNQMHHDDSDSDENRGAVDASFEVRPMFQTGASTGNVEWEDEVETARHAFTKRSRPKTQDRDPILTPVTRRLTHTSATTRRHDILTPVAGTPINFLRRPHSSATVLPESDLTVLARRSTLSREHGLRRQICPCSLHHPTSMEEQGSDV